jgi:hypothetical protein
MKRSSLEQYLAQTDDHIDRATERLERLSRTAIQLKEAGRDTQMADELLTQFERSLQVLRTDRDLILRALTQIGENREGVLRRRRTAGQFEYPQPLPVAQPKATVDDLGDMASVAL